MLQTAIIILLCFHPKLVTGNCFPVHVMKAYRACSNIYIQQDATLHSLFYLETALHVSGGTSIHHQEHKTPVPTAYGICHTVIAICCHREELELV